MAHWCPRIHDRRPAIDVQEWRVPRPIVAVKVAATAAFALLALWFNTDAARFLFASGATLLTGAYAARDLLIPVRLAADSTGVQIARGFIGLRHVDWKDVAAIRVDLRRRFGTTSSMLEIDMDHTLVLFSKQDIGAEPSDAADTLREMRQRALG